MLEKEDKTQETPLVAVPISPTPGATETAETPASITETNKRRVKLGSLIGGGIFLLLLVIIIILVSTSHPTPVPPKPQPPTRLNIANPFRIEYVGNESPKHILVTLVNNRTSIERNISKTILGLQPLIKNTTENAEPPRIQVNFVQLDEHLMSIKYNEPEWPFWEVPQFHERERQYHQLAADHAKSVMGVGVLVKPNQIFEWNFFGKRHDIVPLVTTENCRLQIFEKYIEFEARVQTDHIFGMGERMNSFALKNDNYSLWNRDTTYEYGADSETGTYGSHPFFLNRLADKKNFIGVFMRNSNAMLFSFWNTLNNGTFINYKMIGGIIDLYIFHASDPEYILRKYHNFIGLPYLPPVWGMGFHQARRGYLLNDMKEVVKGYQDNHMPVESIWADMELNDAYKTFTVDSKTFSGLKEFVKELHDPKKSIDMKFVAIVTPGLKKETGYKYYDDAMSKNCLIASANYHEEPLQGRTLAGPTVWLDFFLHDALLVWATGLNDLHDLTDFDGIWISENEVTSLCDGECRQGVSLAEEPGIPNPFHNRSEFDYLQYRPTLDPLERGTISMTGYQCCDLFYSKQYYTHNLYGLQTAQATYDSLVGINHDKRFLIVSRSTWPGSGHYSSHWLGDNYATWDSMVGSIPGMLNFNMFGIPHVGAAIGGYLGSVDSELLVRWYEMGAFYPLMLSYTSATANRKEAYADPAIKEHIRWALQRRYALIRFMYTKMFEAFAWGGPVVHPIFFDFPEIEQLYLPEVVDRSFMWAKTLYVIPALIKGAKGASAYLPNWRWYNLDDGAVVEDYREGYIGSFHTFNQPLGNITVLIKGGSIIPYQRDVKEFKVTNTEDLKVIPAILIIAPDHTGKAMGSMVSDSEGIRPYPHPMSHTYRHYTFTYMNNIFRINKLAGFDFHQESEFDYFWELIILDTRGQHNVDFACMMDMNFNMKELEFNPMRGGDALLIHDKNMMKIPMYNLESIVWGSNDQHDFCSFEVHLESLNYPPDEKSLEGVLDTSDPAAYQLKYDVKAKLLTDSVISFQIIKREQGKYPWIVPDVVPEEIRTISKATKNFGDSGFRTAQPFEPFYFELSHPDDPHDFIFTTRNMPFIYVKDFIQLKFMVNSRHIFGLGERIADFELKDGIYSMFNRDGFSEETGLPPGNNMYGSHPFYMVHLHNPNQFAGVFFLNSNPMDFKVRHVGMQTQIDHIFAGGVIDAFFFQRGSAEEVIKSYQYVIGRPEPLPFWSFGYHQSRWGYKDIEQLRRVAKGMEAANVPYDALWLDKDYMEDYKDFTIERTRWYGLRQFVDTIQANGKHLVVIVDAAIARDENYPVYTEGLNRGVFLKSSFTNEPLIGITWPGYSVWIDFLHPSAEKFWEDQLEDFYKKIPYDGLWLDMNEPSNFCDGECPDETHYNNYFFPMDYYDDLYYNPTHRGVEIGTVSMEALHHSGTVPIPEYNYHNLFGFLQSRATTRYFYARLGKRPFIISSATFPGIGQYASHWLGDNHSSWHMMKYSIAGMLSFQLFGIPFVGADICGFDGNSTIPLCCRWMQLGAFYPFMRNHNSPHGNPQEPFVDPKLASVSSKAIRLRYSLARYLYSSYMHVVMEGGVVTKPVLFDFPGDIKLYDIIDTTFMFGNAIRVTPVLEDKVDTLISYFPNYDWFDFHTYQKVVAYNSSAKAGQNVTLICSLDAEKINLHIKGNTIFAYQEGALSTGVNTITQIFDYPIKLIVASGPDKRAKGYLFYDNDQSINIHNKEFHDIHINQDNNELKFAFEDGKRTFEYKRKDNVISEVLIIGARDFNRTACARVYDNVDRTEHNLKFQYDASKETLTLTPDGYTMLAHRIDYIRWLERC